MGVEQHMQEFAPILPARDARRRADGRTTPAVTRRHAGLIAALAIWVVSTTIVVLAVDMARVADERTPSTSDLELDGAPISMLPVEEPAPPTPGDAAPPVEEAPVPARSASGLPRATPARSPAPRSPRPATPEPTTKPRPGGGAGGGGGGGAAPEPNIGGGGSSTARPPAVTLPPTAVEPPVHVEPARPSASVAVAPLPGVGVGADVSASGADATAVVEPLGLDVAVAVGAAPAVAKVDVALLGITADVTTQPLDDLLGKRPASGR